MNWFLSSLGILYSSDLVKYFYELIKNLKHFHKAMAMVNFLLIFGEKEKWNNLFDITKIMNKLKFYFSILNLILSFHSFDKAKAHLIPRFVFLIWFNYVSLYFGNTNSLTSGPRLNHSAISEASDWKKLEMKLHLCKNQNLYFWVQCTWQFNYLHCFYHMKKETTLISHPLTF